MKSNVVTMLFVFNDYIRPAFIPDEKYWNNSVLSSLSHCLYVITRGYDFRNLPGLDDLDYIGIEFYYDTGRNQVSICHVGSIKKMVNLLEVPDKDLDIYGERYYEYYDKRYAELPKLVMMAWHWQDLELRWKELVVQKPKYMIMEMDDITSPSKIIMTGKDELSAEEIEYFEKERERFLKHEKARQRYVQAHPDYSDDVWRGPQDDEFEADIMRYYEE